MFDRYMTVMGAMCEQMEGQERVGMLFKGLSNTNIGCILKQLSDSNGTLH